MKNHGQAKVEYRVSWSGPEAETAVSTRVESRAKGIRPAARKGQLKLRKEIYIAIASGLACNSPLASIHWNTLPRVWGGEGRCNKYKLGLRRSGVW